MTLSAAQLEARRGYIGSSDAPVACGVDPWREPYGWWLERTGRAPAVDTSLPMEQGSEDEALVGRRFARATGFPLWIPCWPNSDKADVAVNLYRARKGLPDGQVQILRVPEDFGRGPEPWMSCTPDFLTKDPETGVWIPVEAKSVSDFVSDKWGPSGSTEVPINYMVQVMHQMACLGSPYGFLPVNLGKTEFRFFQLAYDAEFAEAIIEAERDLIRCVIDDDPPMPQSLAGCLSRWPEHEDGKVYDLSEPEWQTLLQIQAARERKKLAEEQEKEHKLALAQAVEDAELLIYETKVVATFKANSRGARVLQIK